MLRVASATRRLGASAALARQAAPATGLLARRVPMLDGRHDQRDLTSKAVNLNRPNAQSASALSRDARVDRSAFFVSRCCDRP
jgi:hypothetical protein